MDTQEAHLGAVGLLQLVPAPHHRHYPIKHPILIILIYHQQI